MSQHGVLGSLLVLPVLSVAVAYSVGISDEFRLLMAVNER
jgi:hypothetical protein